MIDQSTPQGRIVAAAMRLAGERDWKELTLLEIAESAGTNLVDLKGHFTTIKPAAVLMRQQRFGRIVNYSSVSGLQGNSGQANYGAAKAGVAGLTRVVARDLGRYGVTVNCIAPGASTRLTATVPDSARELRAARGVATNAPLCPIRLHVLALGWSRAGRGSRPARAAPARCGAGSG